MTRRSPFHYFKTSPEIIRLAVMLYVRYLLSLRNVAEPLQWRCIEISPKTVRCWCNRFGPMFAAEIRREQVTGCGPCPTGVGIWTDWFRDALKDKGIKPCIPSRKSRSKPIKYDKRRYKRRNRIEIAFGRLKHWRRVATRYDRCPKVFLPALALAATVLLCR